MLSRTLVVEHAAPLGSIVVIDDVGRRLRDSPSHGTTPTVDADLG
ncbi:hypothetical protein [Cellulomonas sp. P5_C5]